MSTDEMTDENLRRMVWPLVATRTTLRTWHRRYGEDPVEDVLESRWRAGLAVELGGSLLIRDANPDVTEAQHALARLQRSFKNRRSVLDSAGLRHTRSKHGAVTNFAAPPSVTAPIELAMDDGPDSEYWLVAGEAADCLLRCLGERERRIVTRCILRDEPRAVVAADECASEGSVRVTLMRSLHRLRAELGT